mmetsp:Transcript_26508/g.32503  ORF Transcript_26508/g.32503 Transcript_26508/m.32503 type:complete len:129 (+) Transcript_26508:158-544(+)
MSGSNLSSDWTGPIAPNSSRKTTAIVSPESKPMAPRSTPATEPKTYPPPVMKQYGAIVIDANVFIKQQVRSFLPHLHSTLPPSSSISHPRTFYTTPGVLSEIRDSKSRAVLQELRDIHQITILERNPT